METKLSRQSCERRDLLQCNTRLTLDKVNDFKGLESCKIVMLWCLFKGYTLTMLISFIKEIEFSPILMAFLLYLMQVLTCIVIGEVSYFATLSRPLGSLHYALKSKTLNKSFILTFILCCLL